MFRETLILTSLLLPIFANQDAVIIDLPNYGKMVGLKKDRDFYSYYSFESIPFAKAPVGDLRFKAPVKAEKWTGILDCTKPAPFCPQFNFGELVGVEDCLFLNVYTNSLDPKSNFPVMVFIHGGGFFWGSGSSRLFGPEFLLSQNIVLVTINYRLGHLGSLSFEDQTKGVPGNAHLKDQVMALKWVVENIRFFGGSDSITIFGQSVGAASVHLHVISPMSQGLFNRAIAQSETALGVYGYGVLGNGEKLAKKFSIPVENITETIKQLQAIPLEEFMRMSQGALDILDVCIDKPYEFAPVVETQTNEPAFLPKSPKDLIKENNFNKVPFLLGYNNNETVFLQMTTHLFTGKKWTMKKKENIQVPLSIGVPKADLPEVKQKIFETIFPEEGDLNNVLTLTEYWLGAWFLPGLFQTIESHLDVNHTNMFMYRFSSDTKLNYIKRMHPVTSKYLGAAHMDELGYLFTTPYSPFFLQSGPEVEAISLMTSIWADFARHGGFRSDKWHSLKLVDPMVYPYTEINGNEITEKLNPDPVSWNFWRSLYKKYRV